MLEKETQKNQTSPVTPVGSRIPIPPRGRARAAAGKEEVASDEEGIRALARKKGKDRFDLAARAGAENKHLQPEGAGNATGINFFTGEVVATLRYHAKPNPGFMVDIRATTATESSRAA
jgi:hypothetical protein